MLFVFCVQRPVNIYVVNLKIYLKIRNLVAFLGGASTRGGAQPKRFGSGSQILKAYWKSGCAGSHPVL